jgi:hypothetical protein
MTIAGENSLPGEAPGDKLARLVRPYVGSSLLTRRYELGLLIARGVDKPEAVVTIATNCAMFALGILAKAGANHDLLDAPYVDQMAMAWVLKIARDLGALVTCKPGAPLPPLKPGTLLHYHTAGKNDDHVEWLLGTPDPATHKADHAGGGRPQNAITLVTAGAPNNAGLISWNFGRPLESYVDPDKLGIEIVPAGSDINEAYP